MRAETPQRRQSTAKELAARVGCSERMVRKLWAEPRDEFEARSKERQLEALALREKGLTYQAIADQLGISRGAAAGLVHRARERVSAA